MRACFRCPECAIQVRAHDDLLLVAGMRVSQRARLLDAGVATRQQLAAHAGAVPELSARTVSALTAQARLQIAPRLDGKPPYEIVDAQPLMVLPDHDKGDLFFDFEGDPLWTLDGREWGLEYLWGVLTTTDEFHPIWAHDRASERTALVEFLAMVRKRRKRYPNMHVYHYAAYEKSTLLRLAGRYGVGEDQVDDLLRSGVLVDLFPLVRKSIRVGTENYSIKSLEPLYMGAELRSGEVTTATDSITQYARYCELRDEGHADEAAIVLKEIEDYNRYDCRSTRKLRDWLVARAIESGVPPRGPQPVRDGGPVEIADDLERKLLRFAGDGVEERTAEQTAVAMVAAARGYHKREDKPFWWAHFDRVNNPVDEWADNSDVFIAERTEIIADWHQPPRARKPQRHLRLIGDIANGELGGGMYALYEPPAPIGLADDPDRRAFGSVEVVECDNPEAPTEVVIVEKQPKDGDVFDQRPFALTPGPPINTKPLQESIGATAAAVATGLPALPVDAVTDILLRHAPRTISGGPLPRGGSIADDITAALLDLDSSYLAVHGPPGTGKTFTSATVIERLVNGHGWRVGVVAQSHAVVENLFCDVIAAGVDGARVAKKTQHRQQGLDRHHQSGVRRLHRGQPCWSGRLRRRRHGVGLRQRQQDSAPEPGSAGRRGGRSVQPGQHHRRGAVGQESDAARRPAAAAAGEPGHPPGTRQRVRPRLAGRGAPRPSPRPRLLPRPVLPHASRGVRPGVPAVLRRAAALPRGRQCRPPPGGRDAGCERAAASTTTATRPTVPRRPTRSSGRSAPCSTPRGPTSRAPGHLGRRTS